MFINEVENVFEKCALILIQCWITVWFVFDLLFWLYRLKRLALYITSWPSDRKGWCSFWGDNFLFINVKYRHVFKWIFAGKRLYSLNRCKSTRKSPAYRLVGSGLWNILFSDFLSWINVHCIKQFVFRGICFMLVCWTENVAWKYLGSTWSIVTRFWLYSWCT